VENLCIPKSCFTFAALKEKDQPQYLLSKEHLIALKKFPYKFGK